MVSLPYMRSEECGRGLAVVGNDGSARNAFDGGVHQMMVELCGVENNVGGCDGPAQLCQGGAFFAGLLAWQIFLLLLRRVVIAEVRQCVNDRCLLRKEQQESEQEGEGKTWRTHGDHANAFLLARTSLLDRRAR